MDHNIVLTLIHLNILLMQSLVSMQLMEIT